MICALVAVVASVLALRYYRQADCWRHTANNCGEEVMRLKRQLSKLRKDDGRIVDQLIESGRQEVRRLENYYRRNL